jgi:hypothetical protein
VIAKALTAKVARDLVTAYWDVPNVLRVENANVTDVVGKLAGGKDFARRGIFDAQLALTRKQASVTEYATANIKNYEGWDFEKVWNPLIA